VPRGGGLKVGRLWVPCTVRNCTYIAAMHVSDAYHTHPRQADPVSSPGSGLGVQLPGGLQQVGGALREGTVWEGTDRPSLPRRAGVHSMQ
jgi:hypothetical protein